MSDDLMRLLALRLPDDARQSVVDYMDECEAMGDVEDAHTLQHILSIYDVAPKAAAEIERLRAALEAQEWQPVETAPRDGRPVLLLCYDKEKDIGGRGMAVPAIFEGCWSEYDNIWYAPHWHGVKYGQVDLWWQPTHWRPLPAPPNGKSNTEAGDE